MERAKLGLVLVSILALFGAACAKSNAPKATPVAPAVKGGTLVIGAEQEPDCADWIGSCAGSSWGYWEMAAHTIPRAFDISPAGQGTKYVASSLLTAAPKLDPGPPMKVTYTISAQAVWSDGQPITSNDFKYTWDQIAHGSDIYDKTGYDKISKVDDSAPNTAVVTFSTPYAAWRDLFGAFYGVLPAHILQGKDRSALMKDGYTWSGGPWSITAWNKGQDVTLVPNTRYWGKKPNLDKVVFKFITDSSAEFSAYKTGQVAMIYPQPQIGLADQLKGLPDTRSKVSEGLSYEGWWLNAAKPPLDSKAVRQALAYAIDRPAITGQVNGPFKSGAKPLQAFGSRAQGNFFTEAFNKYTHDLTKVTQLMQGDGWAKGADGIWAKARKRAAVEISTTAGNKTRELVEQLMQSELKEAGFDLKINNTKSGTLFGEWGPKGVFVTAMYAQVPTPDPGLCLVFCSENIPSAANKGSGQNWTRLRSPAIDAAWRPVDTELDVSKRTDLVHKGHQALSEDVPAIPIFPKLTILVWNTKMSGPIDDNYVLGPFWNMNEWSLRR